MRIFSHLFNLPYPFVCSMMNQEYTGITIVELQDIIGHIQNFFSLMPKFPGISGYNRRSRAVARFLGAAVPLNGNFGAADSSFLLYAMGRTRNKKIYIFL